MRLILQNCALQRGPEAEWSGRSLEQRQQQQPRLASVAAWISLNLTWVWSGLVWDGLDLASPRWLASALFSGPHYLVPILPWPVVEEEVVNWCRDLARNSWRKVLSKSNCVFWITLQEKDWNFTRLANEISLLSEIAWCRMVSSALSLLVEPSPVRGTCECSKRIDRSTLK